MVQTRDLKKGDEVLISFPPGSETSAVSFIKFNKDHTKIQCRVQNGRLMWYRVENIVTPQDDVVELIEQAVIENTVIEDLDITIESEQAQSELDKINRLKNSEKHISKKLTKKEQIIPLIHKGLSNKEICEQVNCDPAYASDMRKLLFETDQISLELRNLTHRNKYPKHAK